MSETLSIKPESNMIRIATRGSALALTQSRQVQAECQDRFPELVFDLKIISTTGDQWQTASMVDGHLAKGLFTKELETALLDQQADFAVHSLKDLPTALPEGLILGAVSPRVDARDVLVIRRTKASREEALQGDVLLNRDLLPEGAVLATNSTRRAAQFQSARPDINIVPIRGNVGTRLRKLSEQLEWGGTLLAAAGLHRLQYRICSDGTLEGADVPDGLFAVPIPLEEMIPCVGQAALGLETRRDDPQMEMVCRAFNHVETEHCVIAERAFLAAMGGGCQSAVAAHARVLNHTLTMQVVSYLTGHPIQAGGNADLTEAATLGRDLAAQVTPTKT